MFLEFGEELVLQSVDIDAVDMPKETKDYLLGMQSFFRGQQPS